MKEELQRIIEKYPAEYLEIHVEEKKYNYVSYSGKELENVGAAKRSSGNVRVFKKGKWSFVSFNDKNIEKHVQQAIYNLKYMQSDNSGGLKKSDVIVDAYRSTYKKNPIEISLSEKVNLMSKYNQIILGHKQIQTSRSTYKDELKNSYFTNSEGSYIESENIFTGLSLSAVARDGMNVQRSSYSDAGYYGFEVVEGKEKECEDVCKTVIDLLSADSFNKGTYNVILDPRMAGVFAHEAFGHLSESDFIYENEDMKEMMTLGREFGFEKLNIIDDGSIEGLAGYVPYDDEGVRGRKKYLIKDGKLNSRLNSRETAFQLGEELSGNARSISPSYPPIVRMTNTYIDKGNKSLDELLSIMGNGVYCVNYIGGMTNLEMFTFTAEKAYEVKDGKITRLLKDVVLTGNVFQTLKNIKAIGNDLNHFGGLGGCGKGGQNGLPVTVGGPHVYIENVVIGGK
ncbi:MAG: TldD/PmbA family protein [Spirochaetota bacterium]|nr:TldD/PmbA family protein [Spirochaetota bacterium]